MLYSFITKMSIPPQTLLVDQANLTILKNTSSILYLWAQAIECYMCDLTNLLAIESNSGQSVILDSDKNWNLTIRDNKNNTICSTSFQFGEHGCYHWHVNDSSCSDIFVVDPAQNELKPIFFTLVAILFSLIVWRYCKCIYYTKSLFRRLPSESVASEVENDLGFPDDVNRLLRPVPVPKEKTHRIKCLDVFRGITLSLMIFVNYGGGEYWFFEHSPWNGITVADLIFPWFAWIMGISIAIKIKSELRNSITNWNLFKKICARSVILISLGITVTNLRSDDLSTIRIPGVLQRLGLAYFIVSVLESQFMNAQPVLQDQRYSIIEDLFESYYQWAFVLVLTALHLSVTFFLPVFDYPECPSGYLGPGGIYNHSTHFNCTGGAAGYIDRLIITIPHLYQRPTCQQLYKCPLPYDPEGLLGVLTTVLCVYLGVHAGRIILVFKKTWQRIRRWLLWSLVTALMAGFLCNFSKEEGWIPLNKNLWSLSYVLLCSSLAFLFLSILLFTIDKKTWWNGAPFYQVGINSIFLYIGHVITKNTFPWQWKVMFDQSTHLEYFIQDVWATLLWVVIAVLLHKRNIFVTV